MNDEGAGNAPLDCHPSSSPSEAMSSRDARSDTTRVVYLAMDDALAGRSNLILYPENREWVSAAWYNPGSPQCET